MTVGVDVKWSWGIESTDYGEDESSVTRGLQHTNYGEAAAALLGWIKLHVHMSPYVLEILADDLRSNTPGAQFERHFLGNHGSYEVSVFPVHPDFT